MDSTSDNDKLYACGWAALQEAGIPHACSLGGHFSPECPSQTIINFLELANGRGSGEHANMEPCPIASMALREIVSGILHYPGLYPKWSFTLEQQWGLHSHVTRKSSASRKR